MLYAVKIRGDWYLAKVSKGKNYGADRLSFVAHSGSSEMIQVTGDTEVWSEYRTTAFLGVVSSEEKKIQLTEAPVEFGLRFFHDGRAVQLMQISGGGRLRLKRDTDVKWSAPPRGVTWEVYEAKEGQTYPTREEAEEVTRNLFRPIITNVEK